ncbi:MAG: hypothetical protein Q8L87_04215, partial [Anaerolineales bacterium]|nr:hypothetical protein [Anaerolineales bacterium]
MNIIIIQPLNYVNIRNKDVSPKLKCPFSPKLKCPLRRTRKNGEIGTDEPKRTEPVGNNAKAVEET